MLGRISMIVLSALLSFYAAVDMHHGSKTVSTTISNPANNLEMRFARLHLLRVLAQQLVVLPMRLLALSTAVFTLLAFRTLQQLCATLALIHTTACALVWFTIFVLLAHVQHHGLLCESEFSVS
jgi:hypothetical protein